MMENLIKSILENVIISKAEDYSELDFTIDLKEIDESMKKLSDRERKTIIIFLFIISITIDELAKFISDSYPISYCNMSINIQGQDKQIN